MFWNIINLVSNFPPSSRLYGMHTLGLAGTLLFDNWEKWLITGLALPPPPSQAERRLYRAALTGRSHTVGAGLSITWPDDRAGPGRSRSAGTGWSWAGGGREWRRGAESEIVIWHEGILWWATAPAPPWPCPSAWPGWCFSPAGPDLSTRPGVVGHQHSQQLQWRELVWLVCGCWY